MFPEGIQGHRQQLCESALKQQRQSKMSVRLVMFSVFHLQQNFAISNTQRKQSKRDVVKEVQDRKSQETTNHIVRPDKE